MITSIGTIHTKRKNGARISLQFVHKSLLGKELLARSPVKQLERNEGSLLRDLNTARSAAERDVQENEHSSVNDGFRGGLRHSRKRDVAPLQHLTRAAGSPMLTAAGAPR
jgi:hypothetical protein